MKLTDPKVITTSLIIAIVITLITTSTLLVIAFNPSQLRPPPPQIASCLYEWGGYPVIWMRYAVCRSSTNSPNYNALGFALDILFWFAAVEAALSIIIYLRTKPQKKKGRRKR